MKWHWAAHHVVPLWVPLVVAVHQFNPRWLRQADYHKVWTHNCFLDCVHTGSRKEDQIPQGLSKGNQRAINSSVNVLRNQDQIPESFRHLLMFLSFGILLQLSFFFSFLEYDVSGKSLACKNSAVID